jgi:aldose 1-epimerase
MRHNFAFLLMLLVLTNCQPAKKTNQSQPDSTSATPPAEPPMTNLLLPDPETFGGDLNGKPVKLFILKNQTMQVALTNFGARIVGIVVPDKAGKPTDVALGFKTLADYQKPGGEFFGPIVGRFGNRINAGKFTLDGKSYRLEINNNGHNLHSGPSGMHNVVWDVLKSDNQMLTLTYTAKDGEGGFPGNLETTVTYTLTDDNELKIDYTATTDKATPVNLTSHGFFNLNGEGSGTINNHTLMIDADRFSAVNVGLIPQGEPVSVANTPFDFRQKTAVGKRLGETDEQLKFGGGYDHNFVLNRKGTGLEKAVEITGDVSGITMTVLTTEPAMQFYGGNFFADKDITKSGKAIDKQEAFALEAQHYPDSPNHPTYPNTILKPGQTYRQTTVYQFK